MKLFIWKNDFMDHLSNAVLQKSTMKGSDEVSIFLGEKVACPDLWVEIPLPETLLNLIQREMGK